MLSASSPLLVLFRLLKFALMEEAPLKAPENKSFPGLSLYKHDI
jgi:hypothetical protein